MGKERAACRGEGGHHVQAGVWHGLRRDGRGAGTTVGPVRPFDAPDEQGSPTWGGVHDGTSLYMTTRDVVVMAARAVDGKIVKAKQLPNNVQVVHNVATKTLIQIEHEAWGRSTIEMTLPNEGEVWVNVTFDDRGNATATFRGEDVSLRTAFDAPPAQRAGGDRPR